MTDTRSIIEDALRRIHAGTAEFVDLTGKTESELIEDILDQRDAHPEIVDDVVDVLAMEAMPAELRDTSFDELLEQSSPMPQEMMDRIEALIGDVDVDLDAPLSDEEE